MTFSTPLDLEQELNQKTNNLLKKQEEDIKKIAVGVSGGSDSLALAILLGKWAKKNDIKLFAITVDHGLRKESEQEAKTVKKWLKKYKIEHQTLTWEGAKPSSSIQSKARDARYQLFSDFCKEHDIKHLFLAHQLEDQAETFLIRLSRGSGIDGLCSMREKAKLNGIILVRPFLFISKTQIKSYLKNISQEWIEDPSNRSRAFLRVKMRELLPSLKDVGISIENLAKTSLRMQRAKKALDDEVIKVSRNAIKWYSHGYILLNLEKLFKNSEEVSLRILRNSLMTIGGTDYPPRFERIYRLYEELKDYNSFNGASLNGCLISSSKNKEDVYISREPAGISHIVPITEKKDYLWDNRFIIEINELPSKNMRIQALLDYGWKQIVSKNKDLKGIKIPLSARYSMPAIYDEAGILCVPMLKYIRGDKKLDIKAKNKSYEIYKNGGCPFEL